MRTPKKRVAFTFSNDVKVEPRNRQVVPPWDWVRVKTKDGGATLIPDPADFFGRLAGACGLLIVSLALLTGCAISNHGVFPKPVWYWSKDAEMERSYHKHQVP